MHLTLLLQEPAQTLHPHGWRCQMMHHAQREDDLESSLGQRRGKNGALHDQNVVGVARPPKSDLDRGGIVEADDEGGVVSKDELQQTSVPAARVERDPVAQAVQRKGMEKLVEIILVLTVGQTERPGLGPLFAERIDRSALSFGTLLHQEARDPTLDTVPARGGVQGPGQDMAVLRFFVDLKRKRLPRRWTAEPAYMLAAHDTKHLFLYPMITVSNNIFPFSTLPALSLSRGAVDIILGLSDDSNADAPPIKRRRHLDGRREAVMIDVPDESLDSFYLVAKYLYVAVFALWLAWLYRHPRPSLLAGGAVFFCFYVYLAIVAPLPRPYALTPGKDRMFNMAMAATAATGHSPFESYQVGFGDHEPFWRLLMSWLSLGDPENVRVIYAFLTPGVILLLALSLYFGLRPGEGDERKWELAFIVYAVLLLNSSPHERYGVFESFWPMTFLLKPNHVLGFVLVPLWLRAWTSRAVWTRTFGAALLLALLAWVFLLHWSYLLVGLAVYPLVADKLGRPPEWKRTWLMAAFSAVAATPYVVFLFQNFPPGDSVVGRLVWESTQAFKEGYLNVFAIGYEHGLLFFLSLAGIWAMLCRRSSSDVVWLSLLAGCVVGWAAYLVAFQIRRTVEPEEFYFYTRFVLSVAAGSGAYYAVSNAHRLSALLESRVAPIPQALCFFLLLTLPLSFPYWWHPPTMDRYYSRSRDPIPEEIERLASWVRSSTEPDAVFVAGPRIANWVAALSGRRVLLTGDHRPPNDYERRQELLTRLLTEARPVAYHEAYDLYQVTHLALDADFVASLGITDTARFESVSWLSAVYRDGSITVFEFQP